MENIVGGVDLAQGVATDGAETQTPLGGVFPRDFLALIVGKSLGVPEHGEGIDGALMPIFGGIVLGDLEREVGLASPWRIDITQGSRSIELVLERIFDDSTLDLGGANLDFLQASRIAHGGE